MFSMVNVFRVSPSADSLDLLQECLSSASLVHHQHLAPGRLAARRKKTPFANIRLESSL